MVRCQLLPLYGTGRGCLAAANTLACAGLLWQIQATSSPGTQSGWIPPQGF